MCAHELNNDSAICRADKGKSYCNQLDANENDVVSTKAGNIQHGKLSKITFEKAKMT